MGGLAYLHPISGATRCSSRSSGWCLMNAIRRTVEQLSRCPCCCFLLCLVERIPATWWGVLSLFLFHSLWKSSRRWFYGCLFEPSSSTYSGARLTECVVSPVLELSVEVVEAIPQDGYRGDVSSRSSIAHLCLGKAFSNAQWAQRTESTRAAGSDTLRGDSSVLVRERCVNYIVGCFLVPLERFQLRTVEQLWAFPCTE